MANVQEGFAKGKPIYAGIDVHKKDWIIRVRCQGEEIYRAAIPADPERLIELLKRFKASEVHTVYEAGPTGYGLHDALSKAGFDSMVTPPSLVPQIGGKVKTDQRDSRKLTEMLAGGFLKRVHIPTPEERAHRQLLRTRNQIKKHRKQTQNQIKSMLLFHGKQPPPRLREQWSQEYLRWIKTISWEFEALTISMTVLLDLFHHLDKQLRELNKELTALANTEKYRERVRLATSVPGIGIYTAVAMSVELQDVQRFRRGDQLSSFLGLTPSQHSSGQSTRMGRITRCGNPRLRELFIESSWTLIRYDPGARSTYERIKHQTGSSQKAITAMARRLALRVRRVLIDKKPYRLGNGKPLVAGVSNKQRANRLVLNRT